MSIMNTYRFYGIQSFMDDAKLELDLANIDPAKLSYSKAALLDDIQAKKVFFPDLGRVGFNDISYDLFSFYLPQEHKLASKNKIPEHQPFFTQFEKFLDTRGIDLIRQQHYSFMSLAYMEYYPHVQSHWNLISHLDDQHRNTLIQREILHGGQESYDLLAQHFSSEQLQAFNWTFARGQIDNKGPKNKLIDDFYDTANECYSSSKVQFNLKEMAMFYALSVSVDKADSFIRLTQALEPLNLPVDNQKITQLLLANEIEYDRVQHCAFADLNTNMNTIVHASLQRLIPGQSHFSLEEVGLYNQMNNNLGKMLEQYVNQSAQFEAKGLNNTALHNPVALLEHYCEHPFLGQFAQSFLQDKIRFAKKSENRAFWSYLQIDLSLAHKYSDTDQNNHEHSQPSGLKI